MQIKLYDKDTGNEKVICSLSECDNNVEEEVFNLVKRFNDCISMGSIIGYPVDNFVQFDERSHYKSNIPY